VEKVDLIDDETLGICVAYEQGYGHGLQNRTELTNPYCKNAGPSFMAWNYGFQEGQNKHFKWG
jgi:hypothetical protein